MLRCNQDSELVKGINGTFSDMFSTLIDYELASAQRWYNGWRGYVEDKKGKPAKYLRYSFVRGRLVLLNLFGHMGTELTYTHPAVALYSRNDWVLVGPISTAAYDSGIDTHVSLELVDNVRHESGVKLEAIRTISKARIERDLGCSIRSEKLDEIDLKLAQLYCPSISRKIESYEAEISRLTAQLEGAKGEAQVATVVDRR